MKMFLQRIRSFLSRHIAVWGVDNDIDLFADEKWTARVSDPRYWQGNRSVSRR